MSCGRRGLNGIVGRGNVGRSNVNNVAWHGSDVARMGMTLSGKVSGPNDQIGKVSFHSIDWFNL